MGVSILGNLAALDVLRDLADARGSTSSKTIASPWMRKLPAEKPVHSDISRRSVPFSRITVIGAQLPIHVLTIQPGLLVALPMIDPETLGLQVQHANCLEKGTYEFPE
jgi:hypothetical protein